MNRRNIKKIFGELPYTVEIYWHLVQRHKPWQAHFNLDTLSALLPEAVQQAETILPSRNVGKKIFIFATLHYWIEYSALLGVALAGRGHRVTFSFLPYASWEKPISKYDLRRQNLYARQVLNQAAALMQVQSLLDIRPLSRSLPEELVSAVDAVSIFDSQYTLQVEEITRQEDIYQLRYARNRDAAENARAWLMAHRPDVVIVPNGTIQEMGVVYRVARFLEIPTVTFEFGDQRERIWIAQNTEIMQQDTDTLWAARGGRPLEETQLKQLQALFDAREDARTWKNFARKWQDIPTEGGKAVHRKLGLDERPVVLLATNVLGDSLTLGRQIFSDTMSDWIAKSCQYFRTREDVQLVIRVHPGETLTQGGSMVDVVKSALDEIPPHIHLIRPEEKVNTYDLADITDLGLVYTTTVGMEMAMRGIPVIVSGQTHYRNRGFTYDPQSWEAYFKMLDSLLNDLGSARLSQEQVALSWRYAYLFFFEFPQPFPWHLVDLEKDFTTRPMHFVLSEEGERMYGDTFEVITGQ